MKWRLIVLLATVLLAVAGCSRDAPPGKAETTAEEPQPPPAPTETTPSAPVEPEIAVPIGNSTLTEVNLVATDMGGGIEEISGQFGPGLTGRRLLDGHATPTWKVPDHWEGDLALLVKYPVDLVFSFFDRQPAQVGAVAITLAENVQSAPKAIEVWTSMSGASGRFAKVAAATLKSLPGDQSVSFPAVEARYVKLRVISGGYKEWIPDGDSTDGALGTLEMAEVRVLEAVSPGYTPLFERAPAAQSWKGSTREAAQYGLDWLQQSASDWTTVKGNDCVGCHVQAQALMGQAVALRNGYRVSLPAMRALTNLIRAKQGEDGVDAWGEATVTGYAAMGLAQAAEAMGQASNPALLRGIDRLLAYQSEDGSFPIDHEEPPIIQGQFMTTANAVVSMHWAAAHSKNPKYSAAEARALAWIAGAEPASTQDRAFKIVALMQYGTAEQKRIAWSAVEQLAAEQQPDGGWKEEPTMKGSNAFATGQVLYAFKQAGISVHGEMFKRGAEFLMRHQVKDPSPSDGSWKAMHTQSDRATDFAPTMWAVIGLASAYGPEPTGALQVVRQGGDKPTPRALEIVLDVSGSMKAKLGSATRWDIALQVLKEVVDSLPEDLQVGLRVYGHRHSSKSPETCTDTELLVPLAPLDRERIKAAVSELRPRGETPLVHSTLQTIGDLGATGGGSVILITDGEESCKGNLKTAAAKLKASGLNLKLNIVGFTLKGRSAESQLSALARSAGGRYYGAQDDEQLSRAVKLAAMENLPYDVLDASGKVVASGRTSEYSRELPPGEYRIRVDLLGQIVEERLTIKADETTALSLGIEGDKFTLRRGASS